MRRYFYLLSGPVFVATMLSMTGWSSSAEAEQSRPKPGRIHILPGLRPVRPTRKGPAIKDTKKPATSTRSGRAPAKMGAASTAQTGPAADTKVSADTTGLPQFPKEVEYRPRPGGYKVAFSLEEASLSELVRVISQLTGRRFIFGGKVRDIKATVYSPQKITVAEAYQAFLAILETNGLTVIPQGRFLKIVESPGVVTETTPMYGPGQPIPREQRYVTRLYRLSHVAANDAAKLLVKFKTKEGDISSYAPGNLLIITDTGANIRRMLRIVEEIDVGGAASQIWVVPVYYADAKDISQKLGEIFDVSTGKGRRGKNAQQQNDTRISKIIAEDRTNSLIVVATESAYRRVLEVIKRLDVQQSGDGDVHVLPLQHAMAEELAQTLNSILQGTSGSRKKRGRSSSGKPPEGVFEGSVRVTADKATNSLVVTSSQHDYASLRTVIDKLDRPRRQVFIEAVILDVNVNHTNKFGLSYHAGAAPDVGGGGQSLAYGGFNPMSTVLYPSPENLQGLALGVRGPDVNGTNNLFGTGLSIPAFGVILNALATSSDSNVLATPHIIATDNVAAEINVGQNIPLQTNAGGFGLPGLPSGGATGGAAGALGGMSSLLGMGGLGGFAAPRQDVGTKIKVIPHVNDSNEVRLELTEEISEQGASSGTLGAVSITKRTAQTTVVVEDQQTVVIGGLMRDAVVNSEDKVPVLGDLPLLGFLFRKTTTTKQKTNLMLILTPYIIRDQDDLKTIFERKMQERQEFLDRYFVFSDQKTYEPPKDYSRTNGLVETIRQSMLQVDERRRILEESQPKEVKKHKAGVPIEWIPSGDSSGASGSKPSKTSTGRLSNPAQRIRSIRVKKPKRAVRH